MSCPRLGALFNNRWSWVFRCTADRRSSFNSYFIWSWYKQIWFSRWLIIICTRLHCLCVGTTRTLKASRTFVFLEGRYQCQTRQVDSRDLLEKGRTRRWRPYVSLLYTSSFSLACLLISHQHPWAFVHSSSSRVGVWLMITTSSRWLRQITWKRSHSTMRRG
jgi:hypothetical protein